LCNKKSIKNEGPYTFYRGTLSPLIGVSGCVAIQFGSNEFAKRFRKRIKLKSKGTEHLEVKDFIICGGFSGFCNAFLQCPVELFRIKLQVQGNQAVKRYSGSIDCLKQTYSKYGIQGVYQGLLITIFREVPAFAIYFGVYETLMQRSEKKYLDRTKIPLFNILCYGGLAGLFLWIGTFPIDVIKSCLQADDFVERKYKSIPECIKQLYGKGGIGGFFNGITPCLIRAPPINAATFLTFELVQQFFRNIDNKKKNKI